IDRDGVLIVVPDNQTLSWNPATTISQPLLVVLSVKESVDTPATVGDHQATRTFEQPVLELMPETPPPAVKFVRLARITTDATGKLTAIEPSVGTRAGAVVGDDLTATRLNLRNGDAPTEWPVLSSSSGKQTSLTGVLRVDGLVGSLITRSNLKFRLVKTGT